MRSLKSYVAIVVLVLGCMLVSKPAFTQEKIGVLYVTHGGFEQFSNQNLFDSSAQIFAVRPDHSVHVLVLWNPALWNLVLTSGNGPKELQKYSWEYERIGGVDPFPEIVDNQTAQIAQILQDRAWSGTEFVVDFTGWLAPERIEQFSYPRFLYTAPSYAVGGADLTYCGEYEQGNGLSLDFSAGGAVFTPGQTLTGNTSGATAVIDEVSLDSGSWGTNAAGTISLSEVSGSFSDLEYVLGSGGGWAKASGTTHWDNCDPDRYNVDGPAERFIAEGVDRIIAIDMTTSGVRFFKTFDVLRLFKQALTDNGGGSIPVHWVNDPNDLMGRSLPTGPVGNAGIWTPDKRTPDSDIPIPLAANPNPIAEDMTLATLLTEGAEAGFNSAVPNANTAVLILNHATGDYAQYFDPKIDDTLIINQNIETLLLARNPGLNPDNIVGAFMGIKEDGTAEGGPSNKDERTRNMRGENLGHAWLYETGFDGTTYNAHGDLPGGKWGYLYWDALEYLKNQPNIEHIVIVFPQIVADSVLNLVEQHNQIAKEIGYKNWRDWGIPDYVNYPVVGHPFADYWGIWVDTECDDGVGGTEPCCFEMGGCSDGRPYPPPRQTTSAREDLDPSLAYDVSEYGHLGYNPALGMPGLYGPVQDQYTGTWAFYRPPNLDIRLADMLADHVLAAAEPPDIYGNVGVAQSNINVVVYTSTCGALNPVMTVQTDSAGNYVIEGLSDGLYLVIPEDNGYNFNEISIWVDVPQAEIEPINFEAVPN